MNHHRIFPVYNYRFLLLALHRSLIMLTTSIHLNDRFGHEICCSNDLLEKNSLTAKELGMVLMQPDYIFLERKGGLYFVRFIVEPTLPLAMSFSYRFTLVFLNFLQWKKNSNTLCS